MHIYIYILIIIMAKKKRKDIVAIAMGKMGERDIMLYSSFFIFNL